MSSNNQVARIDPPSADDAVRKYSAAGSHLTNFSVFGEDPLSNLSNTCLIQQREAEFHYRYPV